MSSRKRRRIDDDGDENQRVNRDLAIQHLSKVLQGKFYKGILAQSRQSGFRSRNIAIFNIYGQMSYDLVSHVLVQPFVLPGHTYFYCNQFSLVLEIGLNLKDPVKCKAPKPLQLQLQLKDNNNNNRNKDKAFVFAGSSEIIDSLAFRQYSTSEQFKPPKVDSCVGFIHPKVYNSLNFLLEIISFVLLTAEVEVHSSFYQNKPPFHTVIVQLAPNQILPARELEKIKSVGVGNTRIKTMAVVFHKASNSMRLLCRVLVKTT